MILKRIPNLEPYVCQKTNNSVNDIIGGISSLTLFIICLCRNYKICFKWLRCNAGKTMFVKSNEIKECPCYF